MGGVNNNTVGIGNIGCIIKFVRASDSGIPIPRSPKLLIYKGIGKMGSVQKKDYVNSLADRCNYLPYKYDEKLNVDYDIATVNEIIAFYLKYRSYIEQHMKIERKDLYEYVISVTSYLNEYNSNFTTRLKFVMETMHYIPRCGECGCKLNLNNLKPTHDWPNFCCIRHRCINEELNQHRSDRQFRKTGYRHHMQNPEMVKKMSDIVFEKTGYRYAFQNPETKLKSKKTLIEKYGYDNVMKIPGAADKVFITVRRNKYDKMMLSDAIRPLFTFNQFLEFDRETNDHLWWQCLNPDCMRVFNASIAHGIDKTSKTYARCPFCFPKTATWTSVAEIEIAEYCKKIAPPGWTVYNNEDENWNEFSCQLDILVKDESSRVRCAIEYNGDYYHSVKFQAEHGIAYDKIIYKTKLMENFGIPLIHIYENEWKILGKQVQIKSFIRQVFRTVLTERCFELGTQEDVVKLSRDKFPKSIPIKGYILVGEEPPVEIQRGKNKVLNCGNLVYKRVNKLK